MERTADECIGGDMERTSDECIGGDMERAADEYIGGEMERTHVITSVSRFSDMFVMSRMAIRACLRACQTNIQNLIAPSAGV